MKSRRSDLMAEAEAPNISARRASVPHNAGDFAPAGGGRYLPSVLKSCPMNPSGVQLAMPILPPLLQTRSSSAAALSWFGVNITPKVDTTTSAVAGVSGRTLQRQFLSF